MTLKNIKTDTNEPLQNLRDECDAPVSSEIVEIQKHKWSRKRSSWIKNLRCLYITKPDEAPCQKGLEGSRGSLTDLGSKLLRRETINPFDNDEFVAVSYSCETSSKSPKDNVSGGYSVESRFGGTPTTSKVRDVVLERVIKYAKHSTSSGIFWIDEGSIHQNHSEKKRTGIEYMDWVYWHSKFPVGLIFVQIKSAEEMDLLAAILGKDLERDLVSGNPMKAFDLLDQLISDQWWQRAWIFQEEYRSNTKMKLLIPHHHCLEKQKQKSCLGNIPGEICISVIQFREMATHFCYIYKDQPQYKGVCKKILQRAEKYTITLCTRDNRVRKAMSPSIYSGIGSRDVTNDVDLLPIVANCCHYSERLKLRDLNSNCSLSLCLLTQYFLNGEILWNDKKNSSYALRYNIFGFISKKSFDKFDPPSQGKELTFIKSCRYKHVSLSLEGVETKGQLWKLGKVIDTREFASNLQERGLDFHDLDSTSLLLQLAKELRSGRYGKCYRHLAQDIRDFVSKEAGHVATDKGERQYKDSMVKAILRTIQEGKKLRLAHHAPRHAPDIQPKKNAKHKPYCAIFIGRANDAGKERQDLYVFTSYIASKRDEIEKHVSLEVRWNGSTKNDQPRLITRGWTNGLCFSDRFPDRKVLFPWPPSLAK